MKLVIDEAESRELERHLDDAVMATSAIATVEVLRATGLANPAPEVRDEARRMLAACLRVQVSDVLLEAAAELASREVRTLDAIHLATALHVEADEVVAYDRRLLAAADANGLAVAAPGSG